MPVKSLCRLATEACIQHIRKIDDVGEAPYSIVRPVLIKLENPQQLRDIEKASPQICETGDDAEIWRAFIKRDIRGWQAKNYVPKNPRSWWKVYKRLKQEAEEESREKEEALKAALNQRTTEKQNNQMQYIDRVIDPQKGSKAKQLTTFARTGNPALLTFASGSRTKTGTGKGMLDKARREAREQSLFSAKRAVLSTPTHQLAAQATHGRIISPKTLNPPPATFTPADRGGLQSRGSTTTTRTEVGPVGMRAPAATPAITGQVLPASENRGPMRKRPAASVFLPNKRPRAST